MGCKRSGVRFSPARPVLFQPYQISYPQSVFPLISGIPRIMARKKKRPQRRKGPNRNALCPCGSGRAYKNCCAKKRQASPDKPDSVQNQLKRIAYGLILLILIIGAIVLARTRPWEKTSEPYEIDTQQSLNWHRGGPPPKGLR